MMLLAQQTQPVLNAFLAIAVLAALALLATSGRFRRLRRSRPMTMLISGGWLAVALGVALGPGGFDLIGREDILRLTPLLMIGLGWIGIMIGLQMRRVVLSQLPRDVWGLVLMDVAASVGLVGVIAWFGLGYWIDAAEGRDGVVWRLPGVILLAASAVGWSMETRSLKTDDAPPNARLATFIRVGGALGAVVGVVLFGVGSKIVVRDPATGEQVVSFLTAAQRAGMALLSGVLVALLGRFGLFMAGRSRPEGLVVFLGVVTLLAGVASALDFSPLFAAMLGGIVLVNISGSELERFERFILKAEHVVAALFALLAGVLIDPAIGLVGAAIGIAVAAFRLIVKPAILRVGASDAWKAVEERPTVEAARPSTLLSIAPVRQGPVAIALGVGLVLAEPSVFNQRLLAIIVLGGVLCEGLPILLALRARRSTMQTTVASTPEQMRSTTKRGGEADNATGPGLEGAGA